MKRLALVVSALVLSATIGFAQKTAFGKKPYEVNFTKLSAYLQLKPSQMEEVESINAFFLIKQGESIRASIKLQDIKMHEAVYGNLKLMKKALTPEQYRKYVTLLNITHNNNRLTGMNTLPDVYLADNNPKASF